MEREREGGGRGRWRWRGRGRDTKVDPMFPGLTDRDMEELGSEERPFA